MANRRPKVLPLVDVSFNLPHHDARQSTDLASHLLLVAFHGTLHVAQHAAEHTAHLVLRLPLRSQFEELLLPKLHLLLLASQPLLASLLVHHLPLHL